MAHTLEDFIEGTRGAKTLTELRDVFSSAIWKEGFENFVFVTARNNRVHHVTWSKFPNGYLDTYYTEKWDQVDPILHFTQGAIQPFRWADVAARTKLSAKQSSFLMDCKKLGVHSGLTIPIHAPGGQVDLFSLSLREAYDTDPQRIPYIYAMAVQTWLRKSELTKSTSQREIPLLSARELECLKWAKDGKTNLEIGDILSISKKTVEYHFAKVLEKLGAANRMTAVVIAIQQGLLDL